MKFLNCFKVFFVFLVPVLFLSLLRTVQLPFTTHLPYQLTMYKSLTLRGKGAGTRKECRLACTVPQHWDYSDRNSSPYAAEARELTENVGQRVVLLHIKTVQIEILHERALSSLPYHQVGTEHK